LGTDYGTEDGTTLVKDLEPNSGGSNPNNLTNVNGTLFFTANDGIHGRELWKSNGTATGTSLVKDIYFQNDSPRNLTNLNGSVYFFTDGRFINNLDSYPPAGLWKSDGTAISTTLVKDLSLKLTYPENVPIALTNFNGVLYFINNDGIHGYELWKSDGTTTGTSLVKDIRVGRESSSIEELTIVQDTLFFINGVELWKSDGTALGTIQVKGIAPETAGDYYSVNHLTNVNGTLFIVAYTGRGYGTELWKLDGTEAGTRIVKDIRIGIIDNASSNLKNVDGILYFSAHDGLNGYELWKSDGTAVGTVMVKDIQIGVGGE